MGKSTRSAARAGDSPLRVEPLPDAKQGRPRADASNEQMIQFVREHSPEWCRVMERNNYSTANGMAARLRLKFGPQGYEFRLRTVAENGKSVFAVFARFVGTKE